MPTEGRGQPRDLRFDVQGKYRHGNSKSWYSLKLARFILNNKFDIWEV